MFIYFSAYIHINYIIRYVPTCINILISIFFKTAKYTYMFTTFELSTYGENSFDAREPVKFWPIWCSKIGCLAEIFFDFALQQLN